MNSRSVIKIATRYLCPMLLVLSLVILYRGHNLPGGGFIGGLMASSAVILRALATSWQDTEKRLWIQPFPLIALGLFVALCSGLPALFFGQEFFTGQWLPTWYLPLLGKLKLGTPLLFDIGVYFAVIGFTLKCALVLGVANESWKSS